MAERERFIPQRVGDLTADLCGLPWQDDSEGADRFRSFSRLTSALYHYEFHEREQDVTEAWESVGDDTEAAALVTAELTGLLDGANYTPVTMAELEYALEHESLIPLRLAVDLDDYDELLIYRRGGHRVTFEKSKWMGLRADERTITVDDRVVVYARVKSQGWFDQHKIDPVGRNLVPGHASLRLFQDVPRADIEMLLPSTRVGMRLVDSLVIGVPAVATGIAVLATKLLPTLGLIFLLAAAWLGLRDDQPKIDQAALVVLFAGSVTLGGFAFRQWSKLKNRRLEYLKTLTDALYFRMLAAGPSVLFTLLQSAEQQEVAEVLLAYRFLLDAPEGLTELELDAKVEAWLHTAGRGDVDFEVNDAVAKLRRLGVIADSDRLRAVALPESLARLDDRWDDLFRFRPAEVATHSVASDEGGGDPGQSPPRLIRLRRVIDVFRGGLGGRRIEREADDQPNRVT